MHIFCDLENDLMLNEQENKCPKFIKPILKQPQEKDDALMKKCVSVCTETFEASTSRDKGSSTTKDNTPKVVKVSTAVFFNDDPKPVNSNLTSTFYNKAFVAETLSDRELEAPEGHSS